MGVCGAGYGALTAALLGLLATALLIPEASSLRCHSYSSMLHHNWGGKPLNTVTHNGTESCTVALGACLEAVVTLSAGDTSVTLTQWGCGDGPSTADTKAAAAPTGFLQTQAHVRSCQSDLCNAPGTGTPTSSRGTAAGPGGPTQCYVGLSLDPQPHTLQQVTCEGDDTRCYHGNGTFTAGKLVVLVFMWSCQAPPCAVPPSRHFGPIQLSQAGTCCSGSLCNRPGSLAQAIHGPKRPPDQVPDHHPLPQALARKDHKYSGLTSSTTEPAHARSASSEYHPEPTNAEPTTFDYHAEPTTFDYHAEPPEPSHKGHPPHSTRPRPTEPGKKNVPPKYTYPQRHTHKHPNPGLHKSQAPALRFCPLLVVLGTARLGL